MSTLADSEYILGHLGTVIGVGWAVNVGANDGVCELDWEAHLGESRCPRCSPDEPSAQGLIWLPRRRMANGKFRWLYSEQPMVLTSAQKRTMPISRAIGKPLFVPKNELGTDGFKSGQLRLNTESVDV